MGLIPNWNSEGPTKGRLLCSIVWSGIYVLFDAGEGSRLLMTIKKPFLRRLSQLGSQIVILPMSLPDYRVRWEGEHKCKKGC